MSDQQNILEFLTLSDHQLPWENSHSPLVGEATSTPSIPTQAWGEEQRGDQGRGQQPLCSAATPSLQPFGGEPPAMLTAS